MRTPEELDRLIELAPSAVVKVREILGESGKAKYELISDLWDDYVEVYDGNGNELNHN